MRIARKRTRFGRDIVHRWEGNPVIVVEDIPYKCNSVFNGGVVKLGETYVMLIRVESLRGYSVILKAESDDGFYFSVDKYPVMEPASEEPFRTFEERGIEDPRITEIDGVFYVMYTAVSRFGHCIAVAKTEDFESFERIAIVSEPGNKDGVLFPAKIDGMYVRMDRPIGDGKGHIWLSRSPDLVHWGDSVLLATTREGYWDTTRIGASVPPIPTEEGWLEIYHGVKNTASGPIYRLGTMLLDRNDPSKVIGRSTIPILSPREEYERVGDIGNVVFSCGAIVEPDGEVKLYYGAADTCICLGMAHIEELVESTRPTFNHNGA